VRRNRTLPKTKGTKGIGSVDCVLIARKVGSAGGDWRCCGGIASPYWGFLFPQESPAISKRKPPSQRPELKKDETAQAIARLREEAKAAKSSKEDRPASGAKTSKMGLAANSAGPPKAGGGAPAPSSRRRKAFGG
jgi:hypothetical protein